MTQIGQSLLVSFTKALAVRLKRFSKVGCIGVSEEKKKPWYHKVYKLSINK
jgi:hypothetical protein